MAQVEQGIHFEVGDWVTSNQDQFPALKLIYHCPNGEYRHIRTAVKLKRMLTRRGVPDLFWPLKRGSYPGLYLEIKAPNGKLSRYQLEFKIAVEKEGYLYRVAYSALQAKTILKNYLFNRIDLI